MSYENGTQYYNLPQTQGTDKRDWFDTNESFRNIDTDLHTAMQNSETTQQSLEVTNQKVTLVEGRVQVNEENIATLQGNLVTTNENVATNSGAITSLQTTVTDNKQDLEDMITAYEEATATASRRYEVGDYFRYNDVLYITTVVITQGSTIVPDVNCESTNVMTRVKLLENGSEPSESVIDDSVTSTTKTWSSSKIDTELNNKANANNLVAGTGSDALTFQFATDGDGNYGYRGADDSFIPFRNSSGGAELIGTYTANATIDVSSYNPSSTDEFLAVVKPKSDNWSSGHVEGIPSNGYYQMSMSIGTPSLTLGDNTLTLTVGTISYSVSGVLSHTATTNNTVELYYIG